MLTSHIRASAAVLFTPLPIQSPAKKPGKAENTGPTWVPGIHVGDLNGNLVSWLWPGQSQLLWSYGELCFSFSTILPLNYLIHV